MAAIVTEFLPFRFEIDTVMLAGAALWALALYLGFSPVTDWVIFQLTRWLNFAERSLYTSQEEFENAREMAEVKNAFFASLLSIVPFLIAGALCNYLLDIGLGQSWAVSVGILACVGCGVYELGRRAGQEVD